MNASLQALASTNSGATAPSTTYANMLWYDTAENILKMRSEADDAWINVGYFDQGANAFRILDDTQVTNTSGTQTGLLGDQTTATWEAGTGTTESLVSPAKVKAAIKPALNATGSAPIFACRAWVNFNGSGTVAIRASGNVSSITDNGTGDYTVNLTAAMPDANYCVVTTGSNDLGDATYRNTTNANRANFGTTSFRIFSQGVNQNASVKEDAGNINVAVFR
jgi:hypothetical protein